MLCQMSVLADRSAPQPMFASPPPKWSLARDLVWVVEQELGTGFLESGSISSARTSSGTIALGAEKWLQLVIV